MTRLIRNWTGWGVSAGLVAACLLTLTTGIPAQGAGENAGNEQAGEVPQGPTEKALAEIGEMDVGPHDWPQWMGWSHRNNTPYGENIPATWNIDGGEHIKWTAKLGSQTYGNPVVANGRVYVGTNNQAGYVERFPSSVDLGCLIAFDEETGEFLWQHSNPKLPTGRVHDWPRQGICDAPYVDGERLWYVTSRGEVACLDTEGFHDGENDGPYRAEDGTTKRDADVIWKLDMMGELGVSQHNMAACSVTCWNDILLVCTSNGVSFDHLSIPAPNAPSFIGVNRDTGEVLWTDNSPGKNILHGQWSSPAVTEIDGQPQVIFAGGDGWLYSFDPRGDGEGNAKLLWKFDCNPKKSHWVLGPRGTRNNLIATPVVYEGLVYIPVGQDPEHGEGMGHLWCIDPTKRGDVSHQLAVDAEGNPIPHRREQAVLPDQGEKAISNPNSAMVWHYGSWTEEEYEEKPFEEQVHRSAGTAAIKNDLLVFADFSGLVHCVDAKTGERYWTYDMFSASWGSPLIVDGKVYVGNEVGDVLVFGLSKDPDEAMKKTDGEHEPLAVNYMKNSVYTTPIVANNTLFIANRSTLFAISAEGK